MKLFITIFLTLFLILPLSAKKLETIKGKKLLNMKIQFKNIATGNYIVLMPDPRGGGSLVTDKNPDKAAWYFYQAEKAKLGNVEIKRTPVAGFNWSNYDNRDDKKSFIAWNHAKRIPNATTPKAPHSWTIEKIKPGVFRIKCGKEYLEEMTVFKIKDKNRVITRAFDKNSKYQKWIIELVEANNKNPLVGTWNIIKIAGKNEVGELIFNSDFTGKINTKGNKDDFKYTLNGSNIIIKTKSENVDVEIRKIDSKSAVLYDKKSKFEIVLKKK